MSIGSCRIKGKSESNILGIEYDTNFTTNPYLQKLACEAEIRAALIRRLSFVVPPHLLVTFANGLLMGKILLQPPQQYLSDSTWLTKVPLQLQKRLIR